jgi:UPF0271 protein
MQSIDLNCDLGEGVGDDAALMPLVTSANIAAGFHAGDPGTIRATVALAASHGVAIGAHPSLPDRDGFGRRPLPVTPVEAYDLVMYQAGAIEAFARAAGTRLHHVKAHGALYNMAARDAALAEALARAARELGVVLYAQAGTAMTAAAGAMGVAAVAEVFADRTYQADGTLTPRSHPAAVITDVAAAVGQALRMVQERRVRSLDGTDVPVDPGTICLHGDQPGAAAFAVALRAAFAARGIAVRAPTLGGGGSGGPVTGTMGPAAGAGPA